MWHGGGRQWGTSHRARHNVLDQHSELKACKQSKLLLRLQSKTASQHAGAATAATPCRALAPAMQPSTHGTHVSVVSLNVSPGGSLGQEWVDHTDPRTHTTNAVSFSLRRAAKVSAVSEHNCSGVGGGGGGDGGGGDGDGGGGDGDGGGGGGEGDGGGGDGDGRGGGGGGGTGTALNAMPWGRHQPHRPSVMLRYVLTAVVMLSAGRRLLYCMRLPWSKMSKKCTSPLPRSCNRPMRTPL